MNTLQMGFVFDLLKYAHISIVIDKYLSRVNSTAAPAAAIFYTGASKLQLCYAFCMRCVRSIYGHILTFKIQRVYLQRFITHRKN